MSKKIYATECEPEFYDYRMYYDEDMAEDDGIWAGGNRDFSTTNADLREDVVKALENSYYDAFSVDDPDDTPETIVKYYFKKDSKEALTDAEIETLVKLVKEFNSCRSQDENDIICEVLTITTGRKYKNSEIHGCCQGDWMYIIYPEDLENMISWIEAVWFATGTEFAITVDAVEDPDAEGVEVYYDYTDEWSDGDIKEWIAKNNHVSVDDVVVRKIKARHTHYTYDYEEA